MENRAKKLRAFVQDSPGLLRQFPYRFRGRVILFGNQYDHVLPALERYPYILRPAALTEVEDLLRQPIESHLNQEGKPVG